jgi:hypothetical protein
MPRNAVMRLIDQAKTRQIMTVELEALRAEMMLQLHRRPQEAAESFRTHQGIAKEPGPGQRTWARLLLGLGESRLALELLEQGLDPERPHGWLLAALAHAHLGQHGNTGERGRKPQCLRTSRSVGHYDLSGFGIVWDVFDADFLPLLSLEEIRHRGCRRGCRVGTGRLRREAAILWRHDHSAGDEPAQEHAENSRHGTASWSE